MPFIPFHELYPALAEKETRGLVVLPDSDTGLPLGTYSFLELFCDDPACDCRRVLFAVMPPVARGPQAVVAWGWEGLDFYAKWLMNGELEEARNLQGPILSAGSPRTRISRVILELTRDVLLQDPAFVARIKKHYRLFRARVNAPGGRRPRRRKR